MPSGRGRVVAGTRLAVRVREAGIPPVRRLPPDAVSAGLPRPSAVRTPGEWKGQAAHGDDVVGERVSREAAWSRPRGGGRGTPRSPSSRADRCLVDGEAVVPKPGGPCLGWITSRVTGPCRGAAGTARR